MDAKDMQAIDWPKATIGGVEFTLRLSYPAHAQMFRWGFGGVGNIPIAAWAAAMAGHFDERGKWKSAGFDRWLDVADVLLDEERDPLTVAVQAAIKKAAPEAIIQAAPLPAGAAAPHPN